jgi:anaerobic selenocysteine-containing dehydrogenase
MSERTIHRTACSRDCPDACEILATVEDGRIVQLQGAPDHPVTQGFLCSRTSRYLHWQYSPDRLTQPLVRRGDDFQPISWQHAFDEIAAKLLQVRAESGPASILHYRCGGSMGIMKHVSDELFKRFGPTTTKSGDICSGAGEAAQAMDFGQCESNDFFDLQHSRTIVLWGKNVYASSVHLLPLLREASKRGAQLILIDPVHHRTASICHQYLQPRPGGDAALACGVARWLIDNERHDRAAADYCDHWDAYLALVRTNSIADWAKAADVSVEALTKLAEAFSQGPTATLIGWGMQRRRFGATTIRAVDALVTISGNMGIPGGGASFCYRRRAAFDFSWRDTTPAPRTIPEACLGPGILAANDPPIRVAWITAANPVATLPESATIAQALRSRECTIVVDPFLTDTARCAHYVLPTTTMLEEDDLLGAYGHHYLAEMRPVVPPPEGVLNDYQIIQQLAQRLGLGEDFSEDTTAWKRRLMQKVAPLGVTLESLQDGAKRNPLAPHVVFAGRKFATTTGRVNLITELPAELCVPQPGQALQLAALSTARAQSSQWLPTEQTGPASAVMHPDRVPWATDGQLAELRSTTGSLTVTVKLDAKQRRDVVLMEKGGWLLAGRCANALVAAEETDFGGCAVYYDTHVSVTEISPATARSD